MTTLSTRSPVGNDRAAQLLSRYGLGDSLNYSSSRPTNIRRVEKSIRMRAPRNCHVCNATFGASRTCLACGHRRCDECPQARRTQLSRVSSRASSLRQRRESYTEDRRSSTRLIDRLPVRSRRDSSVVARDGAERGIEERMPVDSDHAHDIQRSSISLRDCLSRRSSAELDVEGRRSSAEVGVEGRASSSRTRYVQSPRTKALNLWGFRADVAIDRIILYLIKTASKQSPRNLPTLSCRRQMMALLELGTVRDKSISHIV